MAGIRHRSRHLHATAYDLVVTGLTAAGWVNTPVNFGATPLTFLEFVPDERNLAVVTNTVAVSLGDEDSDTDWELGAEYGGLVQAPYPIFIDVYMEELSLTTAVCDDIRDIFLFGIFPVMDHTQTPPVPFAGATFEVNKVVGPRKPSAATAAQKFKQNWRVMAADVSLYYQS